MKRHRLAVAVTVLAVLTVGVPAPASLTSPFTWASSTTQQWCPGYHDYTESTMCDSVQYPSQYAVGFAPSQATEDGSGDIDLTMDTVKGLSGAVNTQSLETWGVPATVAETISLPCNSAGLVYNWPAFWMVGTVGGWPSDGEIDIAEGDNGHVYWSVHYVNAAGVQDSRYGQYPAACGPHSYQVSREAGQLRFRQDGALVATVTDAELGVAFPADPMSVINDYAYSPSFGGPAGPDGATMTIGGFSG